MEIDNYKVIEEETNNKKDNDIDEKPAIGLYFQWIELVRNEL